MEKSAEELFKLAFAGLPAPDRSLLVLNGLPDVRYERLSLDSFRVDNKRGFAVKDCWVWCPVGSADRLRGMLTFAFGKASKNSEFFFFQIPEAGSNIKLSSRGFGHRVVSFSARRIRLTAKLTDDGNSIVIGENTYIGKGDLSLCKTAITIGAGGLWSDGVLLQGTDSHGIVDIDTMEIVNSAPKHITLKRRVWLGRGSTVMKGVTIEEGSIVAAGALVTKSVPKACAVGGVPAALIKERVTWSQRRSVILDGEREQIMRLRDELNSSAG